LRLDLTPSQLANLKCLALLVVQNPIIKPSLLTKGKKFIPDGNNKPLRSL